MSRIGLSLEYRQTTSLKQEQRLIITPQLQQAIKLLQLNHVQMNEMLQEELEENPILEEQVEFAEDPDEFEEAQPKSLESEEAPEGAVEFSTQSSEEGSEEENKVSQEDVYADLDWEAYFEDLEFSKPSIPSGREKFDQNRPALEARLTPEENLSEELLAQLQLMRIDKDTKKMAFMIIGNLSDNGWLQFDDIDGKDPLLFLAQEITQREIEILEKEGDGPAPNETPEERLEYWSDHATEALLAVQKMDPAGVGARSLEECLLLQCKQKENLKDPDLIQHLLKNHLKEIERKNYNAIGKKLKLSLEELLEAIETIGQFDPHPGRNYLTEPTAYISPDIQIKKVGEEFTVTLNDDGLPKLYLSNHYKKALKNKGADKEFIQEKLRDATWLLRSIHQRRQTIYKVTNSIVKRQQAFLERGVQYLKPMILKDVAKDIEMHESTISRVTTNKYVSTPQGVFGLKFFFTSSLQSSRGGAEISSLSVKERIKSLISSEDPKSPLSDQQIVKILSQGGVKIARRTIAKYRGMLHIPPSNQRKNPF